jgi:hypothetical protein
MRAIQKPKPIGWQALPNTRRELLSNLAASDLP